MKNWPPLISPTEAKDHLAARLEELGLAEPESPSYATASACLGQAVALMEPLPGETHADADLRWDKVAVLTTKAGILPPEPGGALYGKEYFSLGRVLI